MNDLRKTLIKYAAAIATGLVLVALSLHFGGYTAETALADKYRLLSNAFTIPGVVLLMVGCLIAIAGTGTFDMISYGIGYAARSLIPGKNKNDESFYDYKKRKDSSRLSGYSFLVFVGIAFIAVAIIFLILFYSIY